MTKEELIAALKDFPDDADICIYNNEDGQEWVGSHILCVNKGTAGEYLTLYPFWPYGRGYMKVNESLVKDFEADSAPPII